MPVLPIRRGLARQYPRRYLSSSQSFVQNNTMKWRRAGNRIAPRRRHGSSASSGCGRPLPHAVTADPSKDLYERAELQDILLTFPEGGRRRTVLDIPYLKVTSGEHIGIRGASGSGKSSLLNVVSGLVLPDRGTVRWGATVPGALPEHERDRWRGQHIGFVFQDFQLFPELEALENVLLPATFTGWRIPEALIRRGRGLLEQMHVCPTRKVRALSRGEKQRVAIARAVLLKPGIILADEPTASLDEANAGQVSLLLSGYARTLGSTLLVVSHDDAVLADMDRVLDLNRGIVREAA
ncbi:MAG: ABC transporter ATP-binding protein [Bilophila wadsworthia]